MEWRGAVARNSGVGSNQWRGKGVEGRRLAGSGGRDRGTEGLECGSGCSS